MTIQITRRFVATVLLGLVALQGASYAAEVENVVSPALRQETLDIAKKLIGTKAPAVVGSDPFHSEAYLESLSGHSQTQTSGPVVPVGPRSNADLLQAISASLKPSGFFVLSGEPTLVFGEKRVKAGGTLTLSFEGTEYTLEITSIDRPNFTLRLNREEITRPIK